MAALFEHWSWFAAATVFLGYLVFGLTGFGSALVIIPLLSWEWRLSAIVPLVLLLDIVASVVHTGFNLRSVQWKEVPVVVPFAMAGAWIGTMLHPWSDSPFVAALLGAYVSWIAIQSHRNKRVARVPSGMLGTACAGGLMGLVETLLGTAGPVVMAWLTGRVRDPAELRATAPLVILIVVCIALIGNGFSGHMSDPGLIPRLIALAPVALAGVWAGHRINALIPATTALPLIQATLMLSGLALVVRGMAGR